MKSEACESVRPNLSSQRLDSPTPHLAFESRFLCGARRFGRPPHFWWMCDAIDQLVQTLHRLLAAHVLTAVLLRLDDDHAVARDALIPERKQSRLHRVGQRRRDDVEPQMDCARNLVDV